MNTITNMLKELWPDLIALGLYLVDLLIPSLNNYLATHEHGTILGLLIAALVAWHARHMQKPAQPAVVSGQWPTQQPQMPQQGIAQQQGHPGPLKPPTPPGKH